MSQKRKDHKSSGETKKKSAVMLRRLVVASVFVALIAFVAWEVKEKMPVWMVNWPSSLPKLVTHEMISDPELLWGTYRPHVYFGVKARVPKSPIFGIAWFNQYSTSFPPNLRHWCSQDDKLGRYGWTQHDGRSFGHQEIIDDGIHINTTFVKFCHEPEQFCDWSMRITANPGVNMPDHMPRLYSLIFYGGIDPNDYNGVITPIFDSGNKEMNGFLMENVDGLGNLRIYFRNLVNVVAKSHATGGVNSFEHISDYILSTISPKPLKNQGKHERFLGLESLRPRDGAKANLVMYQLTFDGPMMLDVSFYNKTSRVITGKEEDIDKHHGNGLTEVISKRQKLFREKFVDNFNLPKVSETKQNIAMAGFSNLIGSVGYFYGFSYVAHAKNRNNPLLYGPNGLYTGCPSRSFFPRGFLWDEGFHTLMMSHWDSDIVIQILSHWLDLMNHDGWIPREQILDEEARKRVPQEFILQLSNNANPPAMFITLRRLVKLADPNNHHGQRIINFLEVAYPRLKVWVDWYLHSQFGSKPYTYRWRGRDASDTKELNAKTLTSGLDDYPRASHPTDDEYHVDLRCWIAYVGKVMAQIGKVIGVKDEKYERISEKLHDNKLLNELHWFPQLERYADVGLHSSLVKLQRVPVEKRLPNGAKLVCFSNCPCFFV